MDSLLKIGWYFEPPIDFEHKQYLLFSYLQKVDNNFYNRVFSPFLLHTEKLLDDAEKFTSSLRELESHFKKNAYVFFETPKISREEDLETVLEILEFSRPLLRQRIELGNTMIKKFPSILY